MLAPFATPEYVATSMKRTFTNAEKAQVEQWLDEASEYIREVAGGAAIYPVQTSTYRATPIRGEIRVPFDPLRSVDAVTDLEGRALGYRMFENRILLDRWTQDQVEVTVQYGLDEAPSLLKSYASALVENRILLAESGLGFQFGGLSSVQLDDFRVAFADGGDKAGMVLPQHSVELIQKRYGTTAWVVNTL
jgi:hypothetical protein